MSRFDPFEEIIFEVTQDEVDGGYNASALGFSIHTQGDSLTELRENVREAVRVHFDEIKQGLPNLIWLHFSHQEALTP
jgi:predicted RNase H-like HicB family nuclease